MQCHHEAITVGTCGYLNSCMHLATWKVVLVYEVTQNSDSDSEPFVALLLADLHLLEAL